MANVVVDSSDEKTAVTTWLEFCETMRSVDADEFVRRVDRRLADLCFRLSLPTVQRPLAVYSPVKALAWQKLLGTSWYALVQPKVDMALPRDKFLRWQANPIVRDTVQQNLSWWTKQPKQLPTTATKTEAERSVVQWHRMLQAAYEFGAPQTFDTLLQTAEHIHSSPESAAIFHLVW
jgi:hypothetical protein